MCKFWMVSCLEGRRECHGIHKHHLSSRWNTGRSPAQSWHFITQGGPQTTVSIYTSCFVHIHFLLMFPTCWLSLAHPPPTMAWVSYCDLHRISLQEETFTFPDDWRIVFELATDQLVCEPFPLKSMMPLLSNNDYKSKKLKKKFTIKFRC